MCDRAQDDFDRLTSSFLSNLSHELRTPLTPMKGYARMLGDDRISKESMRSFASAILDASTRLERVIDVLVGVAELDAGRMDARPVELPVLVEEAGERWRALHPARTIVTSIEPGPAVLEESDGGLLSLALDQMIDNAVKFSSPADVISIELRRRDDAADIAVADGGIGVAPEDQITIFSDFRQLDASSTRTYGGLGLGLALVRRVAGVHRGGISIRSEVGKGSTFTLSLPLNKPVAAFSRCAPISKSVPLPTLAPRRRRLALRLAFAAALVLIGGTVGMRMTKTGYSVRPPSITVDNQGGNLAADDSPNRQAPTVPRIPPAGTPVPSRLDDTQGNRDPNPATLGGCTSIGGAQVGDTIEAAAEALCAQHPKPVEEPPLDGQTGEHGLMFA